MPKGEWPTKEELKAWQQEVEEDLTKMIADGRDWRNQLTLINALALIDVLMEATAVKKGGRKDV